MSVAFAQVAEVPSGAPSRSFDDGVLPVLPPFRGLLPDGGLRRGSVVAAPRTGSLCLALAAGASADGAWCAAVGMPDLGIVAAAEAGVHPGRLLLVAEPGSAWPQVVAAMLDGCELVLVRPPARPSADVRRRLSAHARRSGSVLIVAGEWEAAQVRLREARRRWVGAGTGNGRLRGRQVQVIADGRGAAARPRAQWCWLPAPDGGTALITDRMVISPGEEAADEDAGGVVPGLASGGGRH
jgi:hypothetical protein